jgi:hypothetical protein
VDIGFLGIIGVLDAVFSTDSGSSECTTKEDD